LLRIIDEDPFVISTQEGGRRWEESDRDFYISLVDTVQGITVDSMKYIAKDYNITFTITGVVNGKLQYRADSSKAVFQYVLFNKEASPAVYKKNRIIFIACSVLGLLLLVGMFWRKKIIKQINSYVTVLYGARFLYHQRLIGMAFLLWVKVKSPASWIGAGTFSGRFIYAVIS
jgi:hypothetical protein